ncbi:translation protein SH3-like domain-containing protein [Phlebopus sp. FC_14]|nr:translation protein SH3-like domain-containing protein [Phlebopus sp. FC_14]
MSGLRAGCSLFRTLSSIAPRSFSRSATGNGLRTLSVRTFASPATSTKQSTEGTSFDDLSDGLKRYKPITPGMRHVRRPINTHLYGGKPLRALTLPLRKKGGRNNSGRITVRFRGGGHKRRIRIVDFMRHEPGEYDVVRIEYDPGRSGHIALIRARDPKAEGMSKWKYILAPEGLRAGDVVQSYRAGLSEELMRALQDEEADDKKRTKREKKAKREKQEKPGHESKSPAASLGAGVVRGQTIKLGNCLPIKYIPLGTVVHSVSLNPMGKGILVRAAGTYAQVLYHEENGRHSHIRLQSGEIRKVLSNCAATIGKVSNPLWNERQLGKAGRSRWLGRRPRVRGVAMNANDHPHGGGRGRSKSNKHPVSVWGWGTKGTRTRKPGPKGPKNSNKMVIQERPRGKEKRLRAAVPEEASA